MVPTVIGRPVPIRRHAKRSAALPVTALVSNAIGLSYCQLVIRLLEDEDLTPELLDQLRTSNTTPPEGGES